MPTEEHSEFKASVSDERLQPEGRRDHRPTVDRWFNTKFPGSIVAPSTEHWNFLTAAKEELIELLNKGS
jgi:hypothetical protein